MSDVKIQINSVAALDRLMGDDPNLVIEVKNGVVQAFARTTLKFMLAKEFEGELRDRVFGLLRTMGLESTGTTNKDTIGLTNGVKNIIANNAQSIFQDRVMAFVDESFFKDKMQVIDEAIEKAVNEQISTLTKESLQSRIDHAVKEELRKKLGL